jgi:5-methylcytosine-specific restriction endonuclease McrA
MEKHRIWINEYEINEFKCPYNCRNIINIFNFECDHQIPESKGGATILSNLRPICNKCNKNLSNKYKTNKSTHNFFVDSDGEVVMGDNLLG